MQASRRTIANHAARDDFDGPGRAAVGDGTHRFVDTGCAGSTGRTWWTDRAPPDRCRWTARLSTAPAGIGRFDGAAATS